MHKLSRGWTIAMPALAALLAALPAPVPAQQDKKDGWTPLFNGKNLDGWDTWLGRPYKEKDIVGLNQDPRHVYTVVEEDGKPAIRISGEIFGALTSQQDFDNYHLRLEFKWGQKTWPPRAKERRDSGLLYHCVGKHGVAGTFWMQSLECQIMEHDCGDFYSVAGPIVDVHGVRKGDKGPVTYQKGGQLFTVKSRIIRDVDHERPVGQWNTIELLAAGGSSVHIVNGKANMVLSNIRHKVGDKEVPLTRGKIQLQSEGAEVFYRNIAYRPITKIPDKYLK